MNEHWTYKFKSGSFLGVGDDAARLAEHIGADAGGSKRLSLG
jgi:hypothetical protein